MITIIIGMALAFIAGAFCTLKSVQLGLKWQMQTSEGKSPELAIPNPIKEHIQVKRAAAAAQQTTSVLTEWLHGAKE